jgi:hypothetical protein
MSDTSWIGEIEARANAATPGPWTHYHGKLRPQFPTWINEVQCGEKCPIVQWGGFDNCDRTKRKHELNARFIAKARTDIPRLTTALCASLAREKAAAHAMREALELLDYANDCDGICHVLRNKDEFLDLEVACAALETQP